MDADLVALAEQHRTVMANLRRAGMCGKIGAPEYEDGQRWLTFCLLPTGHEGPLHGHPGKPGFEED